MSSFRRRLTLGLLAIPILTGGCAFGRKPYADDPLIKKNRAVWGDREKTILPDEASSFEPNPPVPPRLPLIGGTID